jgi:hypothetical protein
MSTLNCAACQATITEAESFYQEMGQICESCNSELELKIALRKGTVMYGRAGLGMLGLSVIVDPLGLFSLAAALGGGKFFLEFRTKDPLHKAALAEVKLRDKLVAGLAVGGGSVNFTLNITNLIGG